MDWLMRHADRTPVYVALSALEEVLVDLGKHGIAGCLNEGVLSEFSPSMRRQLLAGLKFLGLIDSRGQARPALRSLVESHGEAGWPAALAGVLRQAYAPLFTRPLDEMTVATFQKWFAETYSSTPELTRKCVSFFLAAARSAHMPLGDQLFAGRRNRRRNSSGHVPEGNGTESSRLERRSVDELPGIGDVGNRIGAGRYQARLGEAMFLTELLDQGTMTPVEQEAVWTLLKYVRRRVGNPSAPA